ncbi:MAG: hypothetical protein IPL84_00415 [Chitinophagaceae bacterium]|nr:hypothetical protein [Chitinophagaceae bacterium]
MWWNISRYRCHDHDSGGATTTYFVRAETCNTTTCVSVSVTVNVQPTVSLSASPNGTQPSGTNDHLNRGGVTGNGYNDHLVQE